MPSVSRKQHNFMEAVANNPSFAKKAGVPQSVGQEFAKADKGMKFGANKATLQKLNEPKTHHGGSALLSKGGNTMATKKMASGGITKAKMGKVTAGGIKPHGEHSVQQKGHTKARQPKMAASKPLGMKKGGKC